MIYRSLVIKIFPWRKFYSKRNTRLTLEGEIFRSGNELFPCTNEKKKKKRGTSFEYSLTSLAISTRAKIYISNEIRFARYLPPSSDSPSNLEFHHLLLRSIHGFSSQTNARNPCVRGHKHYRFERDVESRHHWTLRHRVPISSLMEYLRCSYLVMEPFHRSFHFFSFFFPSLHFYFIFFFSLFFFFPSPFDRATRVRVNRNGGRELQGERAVN